MPIVSNNVHFYFKKIDLTFHKPHISKPNLFGQKQALLCNSLVEIKCFNKLRKDQFLSQALSKLMMLERKAPIKN